MTKFLCCAILVTGLAGIAAAAEVDGILIDKMCSAKALKGGQAAATKHDRDCATAAACEKSGYGVYTAEGKWLAFDDAGNKRAIAALKASKKTDDLRVTVTGDVDGDSIKVATLKMR
jgi:hypothetical protein